MIVKFATRRSGSGAGTQVWSYSTDGSTYTFLTNIIPNNGDPALATLDFTAIPTTDNNPNFKLKVEFLQGSGGTVGNNRFDNFTLEGNPSGAPDTTAPVTLFVPADGAVNVAATVNPILTFNEAVRLVDDSALNNSNAAALIAFKLGNASGSDVPFTTTVNGNTITVVPTAALNNSQTYYLALLPNTIEDVNNNAITATTAVTFTTGNATAALASNFITVNENAGSVALTLNLSNPQTGSVDVVVKTAPFSTANAADFTLTTQTLNFNSSSALTQTLNIPIVDDTLEEQQAEYFVVSLENPVGLTLTGNTMATIYIIDNDRLAPVASEEIELNYIGSFDPSGSNSSTCEIVVHDPASQRLFTTSAVAGFLDIINFADPTAPSVVNSINMNVYGGVTSVAVNCEEFVSNSAGTFKNLLGAF